MPDNDLIQSLSRGLQILELVAESEDGLTLQQLADSMGLKPPTAHGLAKTLVLQGFLERVSHPIRYQLGPSVFNLIEQYRNRPLQRRAARILSQLYRRSPTDARLVLAESVGPDVIATLRISPERPGAVERPAHFALPTYTTASGLVFLAYWQPEQRHLSGQRYPFDLYGAHAWGTAKQLDEFLNRVRAEGYALAPAGQPQLCCLAVPIFSSNQDLLGALGLAVSLDSESNVDSMKQDLVARLKAAAEEIGSGKPG